MFFSMITFSLFSQAEMITNGTFGSSSNWWVNGGWSIGSGVASFDDLTVGHLRQVDGSMVSSIQASTLYVLKFDISIASGGAYIRIYNGDISIIYKAFATYTNGTNRIFFETPASVGVAGIDLYAITTSGAAFTIDNISLTIGANVGDDPYYVSADGDDGAVGDITHPWKTPQRAANFCKPGDTIYFRGTGGVFYIGANETWTIDPDDNIGSNGTREEPIYFMGYPDDIANGDSIIFDFSAKIPDEPDYAGIEADPPTAATVTNTGISVSFASNMVFKGFTVRNVWQKYRYVQTTGFNMTGSNNLLIENVVLYNVSGHGFYYSPDWPADGEDSTIFRNCDAFNCVDSFSVNVANYRDLPTAPQAGTWGNGFMFVTLDRPNADTNSYVQIMGCRAWHNADEGMNITPLGRTIVTNFWSFSNGYYLLHDVYDNETAGNGYKINGGAFDTYVDSNIVQISIQHSIAAFNQGYGYSENNNGRPSLNREIYNNTFYDNGSYGLIALNQEDTREYGVYKNIYKNNLSYGNDYANVGGTAYMYVQEYNSWNTPPGVTMADGDFVLIDSTLAVAELKAARKADGSLPDITFLTLAAGSDMIDAGTDVGLDYNGTAPDIGYAEYDEVDSTKTGILTFTFPEQTGIATIDTVTGTPSVDIEVEYGTDISALTPTITLDYGATVSPLSGVETDFTGPVTYTVTAANETTTKEYTVTVTVALSPDPPSVTLYAPTARHTRLGYVNANVTDDGGGTVSARGVCWSTSESPTTSDSKTTRGTGTGAYSNQIIGLNANTTYYVRAYATNENGTAYSSQRSFTTPEYTIPTSGGKFILHNGQISIIR